LLGAGIRRSEAAALTFAHIQQREGRWAIVDLVGKHGRVRTVPMPGWSKAKLDSWSTAGGLDSGFVFRPIDKGGRIASRAMTPQSIYDIVKKYAQRAGLQIAPHDMRRSFARLARKGHAALEQIQLSLGHASVTTTELYLGARQDLSDAPCDHLGLSFDDDIVKAESSVAESIVTDHVGKHTDASAA
jgi:integrase